MKYFTTSNELTAQSSAAEVAKHNKEAIKNIKLPKDDFKLKVGNKIYGFSSQKKLDNFIKKNAHLWNID